MVGVSTGRLLKAAHVSMALPQRPHCDLHWLSTIGWVGYNLRFRMWAKIEGLIDIKLKDIY